jgi:uncharacterized protein (DUF2267 family)
MTRTDFIAQLSARLDCDAARAEAIATAVFAAVRAGLSGAEAHAIAAAFPPELHALWPREPAPRPELVETGGEGFLGRVRRTADLASDRDAARATRAVFRLLLKALAVGGGSAGGAWKGLQHLPPELKSVWMRMFRAANFPVESLVQRPRN